MDGRDENVSANVKGEKFSGSERRPLNEACNEIGTPIAFPRDTRRGFCGQDLAGNGWKAARSKRNGDQRSVGRVSFRFSIGKEEDGLGLEEPLFLFSPKRGIERYIDRLDRFVEREDDVDAKVQFGWSISAVIQRA